MFLIPTPFFGRPQVPSFDVFVFEGGAIRAERKSEGKREERRQEFHPKILLPSSRGYGSRRADSGRSYHFSGGDWLRGGWRMRTGCLLLLPTLTFLTSLLAALFARDRLCEVFLDTSLVLSRSVSPLPLCAASLPNRNSTRVSAPLQSLLPLFFTPVDR